MSIRNEIRRIKEALNVERPCPCQDPQSITIDHCYADELPPREEQPAGGWPGVGRGLCPDCGAELPITRVTVVMPRQLAQALDRRLDGHDFAELDHRRAGSQLLGEILNPEPETTAAE